MIGWIGPALRLAAALVKFADKAVDRLIRRAEEKKQAKESEANARKIDSVVPPDRPGGL